MTYKKRHGAVLGVQEVPHQEVNRYGIVSPERLSDGLYRVEDLVEKPAPAEAPSNLGRHRPLRAAAGDFSDFAQDDSRERTGRSS